MQILAKRRAQFYSILDKPASWAGSRRVSDKNHMGTETRRGCRTLLTDPRISRTPAFALFFALCHSVDGPSSTGCFMLRSIFKPLLSTARSSIPCRFPQRQQAPERYCLRPFFTRNFFFFSRFFVTHQFRIERVHAEEAFLCSNQGAVDES